jgi:hypothetical protein
MSDQRVFPGFALIEIDREPPRDPVRWEGCESRDYGDQPVVLLPVSGTPGKDLRVGPFEEWMVEWVEKADYTGPISERQQIIAALEAVLKGAMK